MDASSKDSNITLAAPVRKKSGLTWGGFLLWILSTGSTLAVAWFLLLFLYVMGWVLRFTELPTLLQLAFSVIGGLFLGSIVGAIQATALIIGRVVWARNWFSGTAIGWGMAGGLGWVQYFILGGDHFSIKLEMIPMALLFVGVVTGAAVGFSQWLITHQSSAVPPWWIVISAASWAVGAPSAYTLSIAKDFGMLTYLVLMFLTGLLVDLMTGAALHISLDLPHSSRHVE